MPLANSPRLEPNKFHVSKLTLGIIFAISICYINYQIIPIFYKHILLKDMLDYGLKEQVRVTTFNGHMGRVWENKVIKPYFQETVKKIGFATNIDVQISSVKYPTEEIVTVECSGSIPIDLIVYTINYGIYERHVQIVNRGGY